MVTVTSRGYYVPTATRRIFSSKAYFQHDSTSDKIVSIQNHLGIQLKIQQDTTTKQSIVSILYNECNNLPTFYACQDGMDTTGNTSKDSIQCGINSGTSVLSSVVSLVTDAINTNLSSA